jgi:hypothetical protein
MEKKDPFHDFPLVKAKVMYAHSDKKTYKYVVDIIRLSDISGHISWWKAPPNSFGIKKPTIVLIDLSKV